MIVTVVESVGPPPGFSSFQKPVAPNYTDCLSIANSTQPFFVKCQSQFSNYPTSSTVNCCLLFLVNLQRSRSSPSSTQSGNNSICFKYPFCSSAHVRTGRRGINPKRPKRPHRLSRPIDRRSFHPILSRIWIRPHPVEVNRCLLLLAIPLLLL